MLILSAEVQRKNSGPETNETIKLETSTKDLLETLYWNIHGGSAFHIASVCDWSVIKNYLGL